MAADDDIPATDEGFIVSTLAPGLLANDSDPDGDHLVASKLTDPAHGSVTVNADGSFSYVPAAGWHGTDSFEYRACDPSGLCDTATVALVINAVNDAPEADDDAYETAEDAVLEVSAANGLLANDSDPDGDVLEASRIGRAHV